MKLKRKPRLFIYVFLTLVVILFGACTFLSIYYDASDVFASSDGSDDPEMVSDIPEEATEPIVEIFARVQYLHDLIDLRTMLVEARAYPGAGFPLIEGGYVETNVHAVVRIRGITVPTDCQTAESRQNRPHAYIERERERWNSGMAYLWGLVGINKVIKIVNPEVVDGIVECDIKFFLGGAWHELDTAMVQDDYARRIPDGFRVDWGSELLDIIPLEE